MSKEELFIKATRNKLRFPYRGLASVEDLWDLPVTELDKIYKSLKKQEKTANEESLLEVKTDEDEELTMQIEIVKYIVGVKLEEKKAAENAKERKEQKEKLLRLLADKQDEELKGKTAEEIQKMIDELG